MRKRLVLFMMSTLICLSLAGCGKASPEAQAVIDKIDTIGEVTLDDEILVDEIEKDYLALTEEQQGEVKNFKKLSSARDGIDELYAKPVIEKIDSIGEVDFDDELLIGEIEEAYYALTDSQKAKVTNIDKLTSAREEIDKLLESKPLPFSYANWETTTAELKSMLGNPNEEYDADSGNHVLQYDNCEYDGYKGLVRYLFADNKMIGALFIIDGFETETYNHFKDLYTTKYGEPGFSNSAGDVWYTSNVNVGITGTTFFGGMVNLQFYKPAEE